MMDNKADPGVEVVHDEASGNVAIERDANPEQKVTLKVILIVAVRRGPP